MEPDNIYNTFDKSLYRQGSPVYTGDGNPLSDISNIAPSTIGDGFSTGSTEMVTHALQSGTFQTGVRGWQIDAEGNAEFNNGTFRGTFEIGGTLITVSDIANLATAISDVSAAGGGTVALVPDTYTATQSYSIPSNVTIDGNGSTIDFGGGAFQFLMQGTNAYSTGTVSVNFNSTTVTGVGTTWIAGMIGQSILLGDFYYTITARASNTSITISPSFKGVNISGDTYVIATTVDGVALVNITIQNSSISLIKARYVNGFTVDTLTASTGDIGLEIRDTFAPILRNFSTETCTTAGLLLNNTPYATLDIFNILSGAGASLTRVSNTGIGVGSWQKITGVALSFTNCYNIGLENYSIIEATSHGIEFVSGNSDIDVVSGYTNTVGGDGIKLTASTNRVTVNAQSLLNYTGYGINIAASSCTNNIIYPLSYGGGGSGTLSDSGTGTVVIADDTAYGASWNGNLGVATKNAVYDKIETISLSSSFGTFDLSTATVPGTTVIAHGLGKTPKIVRVTALSTTDLGTTVSNQKSIGASDGSSNKCIWDASVANATNNGIDTTKAIAITSGASISLTMFATITLDSTNITFNWTGAVVGIGNMFWQAEA